VVGILAGLDPDLPVWTVPLSRLVADSMWAERAAAALLSLFGSVALALCGVGLFAMVAFNASQRTRELAIRSALGASRRALATTVGREAALLVGVGITIGSGVLIALGRSAKSFVHEVSPTDPASLAGTAILLSMVGAAACLAPLRRATRVDAAVALRSE
jgi:ABC-type antimicrobial peptide transport system permease subunit